MNFRSVNFRSSLMKHPAWTRFAGLCGIITLVVVSFFHKGTHPSFLEWLLLAIASITWGLWTTVMRQTTARRAAPYFLVVASLAAGALSAFSPWALGFFAGIGMDAGETRELPQSLVLTLVGPGLVTVIALTQHHSLGIVGGALAGALLGLISGTSRREHVQSLSRDAELGVERERADLLVERNRLAREIHDVLAHSLGALSVHLDALDAVVHHTDSQESIKNGIEQARDLVRDGLNDARRAVRALRDDAQPLYDQLSRLVSNRDVSLRLEGHARSLPEEASLAMYRAGQEALSNAHRHSPGAHVSMYLRFEEKGVRLEVMNPIIRSHSAAVGSGYGIQGMKERAEMLGGWTNAGPGPDGWKVTMWLPV